ncbi:MAG: crossover junction endodeoxyribonuclease RuvC [Leptospiraceae bacterium]|nr:crossover junction endodeoxyribonuclease RuvC [Leptospiraceae bacterium]
MKILGIDPGSHRLGYAILEQGKKNTRPLILEYGVLEVKANTPSPENLLILKNGLSRLIQKFEPELASIEKLFFHKNAKTAVNVYEARGVVLLQLHEAGIKILQPTVSQIKKGITGKGTASKKDLKSALEFILGEKLENIDDSWDAIAAAFVGLSMDR